MMYKVSVVLLLLLAALTACDSAPVPGPAPFDLESVLGGDDTEGFLRADAPRAFTFPEDHGPHVGFRNEWWYFTGNLDAEDGRRFGYQLTFFNSGLRPTQDESPDSAWRS